MCIASYAGYSHQGLLLILVSAISSAPYIKIERIDWFLYALTLCYITYSVVILVMVVQREFIAL